MNEAQLLQQLSKTLASHLDATPEELLRATYAGYKAWTRKWSLQFQESRRLEFLESVMRYCAETNLVECVPDVEMRTSRIISMLECSNPQYAARRFKVQRKRGRRRGRAGRTLSFELQYDEFDFL